MTPRGVARGLAVALARAAQGLPVLGGAARVLAVALAGAALMIGAAGPAAGADRLDRIAGALKSGSFYVDPEAAHALPPGERTGAKRALTAVRVPVYTVVVPLTGDDESEGDGDAFLHALHDRLGRDGVYVVANQDAQIEAVAFGVPREVDVPTDVALPPAEEDGPTHTAGARLLRLAELIRTAPAAAPESPEPLHTPEPFGAEDPTPWPEFGDLVGVLLLGLLLAGPLAGGLLYGAYRLVARLLGYRPPAGTGGDPVPDAPTRPSERWLRRTATEALAELGERLATEDPEARPQVHARAAAAYDAGLLLLDERDDPMDLLGAVLLARDGAEALRDGDTFTPPFCFLNPLHGRSRGGRRRQRSLDLPEPSPERRGTGKVPVCGRCGSLPKNRTGGKVLIVGGRPYYAHPGFWNETGLPQTDLPARVLEYLGVE